MTTTARQIMTKQVTYLNGSDTIQEAAKVLADRDVGAAPVCDADGKLIGMVSDRDIVVKVIAEGKSPALTTCDQITDQPEVVTIGADDNIEEAVMTMKRAKVRRLPVIDGTKVVGMVSQADIARVLPDDKVGELLEAISS